MIAGVAPYDDPDLDWLAGMGEDNLHEFERALAGEPVLRSALEAEREGLKSVTPEGILSSLASLLPAVDRPFVVQEFGEDLAAGFHEGLRLGAGGWIDDDLAFVARLGALS